MKKGVTINLGAGGLLGVVLIVLKATGYLNWPWVWVLAPYWLPLVIFLTIMGGILSVLVIAAILGVKR